MEVLTAKRDRQMADVSTDSFEFNQEYSEMFEDRGVELPDLEETQIWDSPNVTVNVSAGVLIPRVVY